MAKIFLIIAIVLSLGTAILGFTNKQKLDETKADLSQTAATLGKTKTSLDAANKDLTDTKATLATTTAEKEQAQASLTTAQSELTKATADLTDTKAQLTEKETSITSMQTEIAGLQQQIADLSKPDAGPVADPSDATAKAELEALVASLETKLNETEAKYAALKTKDEERMALKMREGLEGRVLAVNPAWNFVVLSIGDRNGVVNNAELLVKRGGQYLGKVRITSVEPSTSIADIVANSMPSGISVQPGDSVIYQSSEN